MIVSTNVLQDFPDLEQALAALLAEQLDQRQDASAAAHVRTGMALGTAATQLTHESIGGDGGHDASMPQGAGTTEHATASVNSNSASTPTANGEILVSHTHGDNAAAFSPAAAGVAAETAAQSDSLRRQSDARPPSLDLWGAVAHSGSGVLGAPGLVGSSGAGGADPRGDEGGAHASGAGAGSWTAKPSGAGTSGGTSYIKCTPRSATYSNHRVPCAPTGELLAFAGALPGSPPAQSVSPAAAQARGHAGEGWLEDVLSEVVAAERQGAGHSSGSPLTFTGPAPLPPSVAQPLAEEAVLPREDFSFAAHGEQHAPGVVVPALATSRDGAATAPPAHGSSLEANGAVPAQFDDSRRAGGGDQPSASGSLVPGGLAASGVHASGRAADCGLAMGDAVIEQCLAGGLQRDDDGCSAFAEVCQPLQAQPTPGGGLSALGSCSVSAGTGRSTEPGAGLSFLLQPGLDSVPSPGAGTELGAEPDAGLSSLLQPGMGSMPSAGGALLSSPTRTSTAAPPGPSSPGFVHGIPRLHSAAAGRGSPFLAGNMGAAGLGAAATFGAAPHGLGAGSSVQGSASAPSRQFAPAGPASMAGNTAQGVSPGHATQAGAAATSAQTMTGIAAHVPANGAAASSSQPAVAGASHGAAASHVAAAESSHDAVARANGYEDGVAIDTLVAQHGVAGTAAGVRLHSSALAAPGARGRDTEAAPSQTSQVNAAFPAESPAELHQQVQFCSRPVSD